MKKAQYFRRILTALLLAALVLSASAPVVYAADAESGGDIVAAGNCANEDLTDDSGAEVIWTFYRTGRLTLSGEGSMPYSEDWEAGFYLPWEKYRHDITSVVVKDGVYTIGRDAFTGCDSITSVDLGGTVTAIFDEAFACCSSLKIISIPVSLTIIVDDVFVGCDSLETVYYAGTKEQWESINIKPNNDPLLNAEIIFGSGAPAAGDEPAEQTAALSLSELTSIDYLAFTYLSYSDCREGRSVGQLIAERYDEPWEGSDFTYGEIFAHIEDWSVLNTYENSKTGFYAVSFKNRAQEVVLAYRGSRKFGDFFSDPQDWGNDWLENDIPAIFGSNSTGKSQIPDALAFYNKHTNGRTSEQICVTGHSLGGALADIVAAYSGCYGETFNAISAIDAAYLNYPEMVFSFKGTDKWIYTDHVNVDDRFAGAFDCSLKPHIKHTNLYKGSLDPGAAHGLDSIVCSDEAGRPVLSKAAEPEYRPDGVETFSESRIQANLSEIRLDLVFGTSGSDTIGGQFDPGEDVKIQKDRRLHMAGGDGSDTLFSHFASADDMLYGGGGDNNGLNGDAGNDLYWFKKGDGLLTVFDCAGSNTLRIFGYENTEKFSSREDGEFTVISDGSGMGIIRLHKSKVLKPVYSRDKHCWDIPFGSVLAMKWRALFSCPVDVEILDKAGSVVLTLRDLEEQTYYTDYGYFYVRKGSDGEYTKVAELTEGYSVRAVGTGDGTMECMIKEYDGTGFEGLTGASDIPVTASSVFTLSPEHASLSVDTDGDGKEDDKIKLMPASLVEFDSSGGRCELAAAYTDYDGRLYHIPVPERDGYVFSGWNTSGGKQVGEDTQFSKDSVVTAVWEAAPGQEDALPQKTEYPVWLWIVLALEVVITGIVTTILLIKLNRKTGRQ